MYVTSKNTPATGDKGFIVNDRFVKVNQNIPTLLYLASDGYQWIDTLIPANSSYSFELKF